MEADDQQREQTEFLLSQYLDGDLGEAERAALERRLEADARLAALLEELRATDRLVNAWAMPVPELDWDRFTNQASAKRQNYDAQRRRGRILRLYAPLSAAAAIALAVTVYIAAERQVSVSEPAPVALVSVHRADAWRGSLEQEQVRAEVSFDRSAPPITDPVTGPSSSVAVASVGVGPWTAEDNPADADAFF